MRDHIETLRLRIEPFSDDDAATAFAWRSDPEVMRFIPTGPDKSIAETNKRLARYIEHQTLHGFSKWIIRERASGLATEAASAWVRAAFGDNRASLRVLQKLHFRSIGHDRVMGMDSLVYSLGATEFQLLAGKWSG